MTAIAATARSRSNSPSKPLTRARYLSPTEGGDSVSGDLDAIRNIGTSEKEIGESIGNKGLGFRSTEALTYDIRVYSQLCAVPSERFDGYCFRFAQTEEIAELLEEVETHPGIRRRVARTIPRYLTPLPLLEQDERITAFARDGFATVVQLPLETEDAVCLARKQVLALDSRDAPLMLFLRRLRAVNIQVSQPRKMGRQFKPHP